MNVPLSPCSLADLAVTLDLQGFIRSIDSASSFEVAVGVPLVDLIHPDDADKLTQALETALFLDQKQSFVCRFFSRGDPVWVDCHLMLSSGSAPPEFLLLAFDVSHWQQNDGSISHLATHDSLTDLPNRTLLSDRIKINISAVQRQQQAGFALQLLDLDGFKKINDSLGHAGGDKLIKDVAKRLKGLVRESDTLARIGGDEFAFILSGISNEKETEIVVKKILTAMQRPFRIDGNSFYLTTSIGTAIYPEHGKDPGTLFKHAEMAMYSAKENGGNCWRSYDRTINPDGSDVSIESAMHEGMRNGEFLLHYQPIYCAKSGKLRGAEALMRWENPEKGMISPGIFIPIAESSTLIELLGRWALRMACHQAMQWVSEDHPDFYMSVNVSPRQFRQEGLLDMIKEALEESGLPPSNLMIEITEGVLMHDPEKSYSTLKELRDAGVKIAVDDFGTGYSSLAYLKKFPLSVLKIDKSFVDELPRIEDVAIISAVLSLAKGLGLSVVAEGVESQEQFDFLASRGCDLIQGYLKGRPVSSIDFQTKHLADKHES
jgi:diguanylate cyclase (GGDEF)-like protein